MSPLLMRVFALVAMALAAASMQMKARAETPAGTLPLLQAESPRPGTTVAPAGEHRMRLRNDR